MIKKDTNTISFTMKPKGIIRKYVFFLSLILGLLPNFLFATSIELSDEVITDSDSTLIATPKPENNVLYISEGTIVYGMENISQKSSSVHSEPHEKVVKIKSKKQISLAKTEEKKPIAAKKAQKTIVKIYISNNSKDFFDISKTNFNEGTINTNLQFKVSVLNEVLYVYNILPRNTNSIYTYSNFLKGGMVRSNYFTRPPPSFT